MTDEPEPRHDQAPAPEPTAPPAPTHEPEPHLVHETRETFQPLLYAKIASLLFVVAYAIAFVVDNRRSISVDFVFATANVSLIWTILLLLAVGLVGGVLLSQLYRHRRQQQLRKKADAVPDLGGRHEAEGEPGGTPASS
jgi:uncharacterized integral membrane protein